MSGISSLLNTANGALFASQSAIHVTGNNIANVNTEGYSRRTVRFEENTPFDAGYGQMGSGAHAAEIIRHFNTFVEEQFHDRSSQFQRWNVQQEVMQSVEALFNEANTEGLNAMLSKYFDDWQALADRPGEDAVREALLADTGNLITLMRSTSTNLREMQSQMDEFIEQEVGNANKLIDDIAEINRQLIVYDEPGENNANTLLDRRDKLVRELGEIVDIDVINNGTGNFIVNTKAGHTLVDGVETFELKFESANSYATLDINSNFDGELVFEGRDEYEYTVEVVNGGTVGGAGAAEFRVSLDGGRTWIKDENGADKLFTAEPEASKVTVQGLDIYFQNNTQDLTAGDSFTIVPKSHITWDSPTRGDLNITPQQYFDGTDNSRRLVGGRLSGYFMLRDFQIGRYQEKMDALANSVVWETNRLHAQGANQNQITNATGNYSVGNETVALGNDSSGLEFRDKLKAGNFSMAFYDSATGELASATSLGPIDFSGVATGIANFDPDVHSLEDVRDAINNTWGGGGGYVTASIENGALVLNAQSGYDFKMSTDTTGLTAALGINTYFKGSNAADIAVREEVRTDSAMINSAHVNGAGEVNFDDNYTAGAIADLRGQSVTIATTWETSSNQSIQEFYNGIAAQVGADTANAKFNSDFNEALARDLNERQNEVAGVNLDEEMSNLIKYQHSYKAAAKLITTADQMMETILSLKN